MATLPSGLDERVADDEPLARFLTQSNQFNSLMAKPAAFLPSQKPLETSVSRHGSESLASLWAIGLAAAGNRNLYGAAIFKARAVRAAQLGARVALVEKNGFFGGVEVVDHFAVFGDGH